MSDKPTYMKHMPHFLGPVAPITIDHAEGSWVYDTDGGKWLDFVVGIAVVNTGHCHPKVVKAVQEQAAKVPHAQMNIYRHGPMLELAEKLTGIMPDGMDEVMFGNSGRRGRRERHQARQAGHAPPRHHRLPGRLPRPHAPHHGAHRLRRALPRPSRAAGRAASTTRAYCYPYRTPASEDPTAYAIEDVRRVLRAEIYGDDVAAIIVEPIQGEGGFIVPTVEFMHGAARDRRRDRRLPHHRRDPGRLRPHRQVALPGALRRQGRHRHRRQGHRLRLPARRHRRQPRALGQVPARLDGRHLRRQRRRLRRRRRHHGRHEGRGHARERHAPGREAAQVLHRHAGDLPVHRRGPRQGPHGRHRVRRAGHQGAQRGGRQGVHRRVQQAAPHHHGRRLVRELRPLPPAAQHQRRGHGLRVRASSPRPPRSPSPESAGTASSSRRAGRSGAPPSSSC